MTRKVIFSGFWDLHSLLTIAVHRRITHLYHLDGLEQRGMKRFAEEHSAPPGSEIDMTNMSAAHKPLNPIAQACIYIQAHMCTHSHTSTRTHIYL